MSEFSAATLKMKWAIFVSVLGLCLTGCDTAISDKNTQTIYIEAEIAAWVNDQPIYTGDLAAAAIAQDILAPGEDFTRAHPDYATLLANLIDQSLLAQEAEKRALDKQKKARHRLRIARQDMLQTLMIEHLVETRITQEVIADMYAEQVRLQQIDDEVEIRQLTVTDEAKIRDIKAAIDKGAEFATLAMSFSIEASSAKGGDIGYIRPNRLGEPLASMIGNTPTGAVSEPFQTETGWSLIKVEARRQAPPKTFEEMRSDITRFLTYTELDSLLDELRTSARINYATPERALPARSDQN